jgi:hypothetical protein
MADVQQGQRAGNQSGGYLLSISLVLSALLSISVDFSVTHLFNPAWPPHAKFHGAAMLNLLAGACAIGLWMLWRKSTETGVAALVAALVPVVFWSAFFWVSLVIPGASLEAIEGQPPPAFAGIPLYPNVIAAIIFVSASLGGLWMRSRSTR